MDPAKGLGHIFAGGDVTYTDAHQFGERTAGGAWLHAGAIIENILKLAGKREPGNLQQAAIGFTPGTDLGVSLGTNAGFLHSCNPGFVPFFHTADELSKKCGIMENGLEGWNEVTKGTWNDMGSINWLMFHLIPEGAYNMMVKDDMTIWGMFVTPALCDLDTGPGAPRLGYPPPPPPPGAEGGDAGKEGEAAAAE